MLSGTSAHPPGMAAGLLPGIPFASLAKTFAYAGTTAV